MKKLELNLKLKYNKFIKITVLFKMAKNVLEDLLSLIFNHIQKVITGIIVASAEINSSRFFHNIIRRTVVYIDSLLNFSPLRIEIITQEVLNHCSKPESKYLAYFVTLLGIFTCSILLKMILFRVFRYLSTTVTKIIIIIIIIIFLTSDVPYS